jgi:hypothetical protein
LTKPCTKALRVLVTTSMLFFTFLFGVWEQLDHEPDNIAQQYQGEDSD